MKIKTKSIRLGGAFALGAVLLVFSTPMAMAKETKTFIQGVSACYTWCDQHNQTTASQNVCKANCQRYWACYASDATYESCYDTYRSMAPTAGYSQGDPEPKKPKILTNQQGNVAPRPGTNGMATATPTTKGTIATGSGLVKKQ